jgi:hypothetical protein
MESSAFEPLYAAHVDEIARRYAEVLPRFGLDAVVLHSGKRRLRREFDDDYSPLIPLAPFAHFIALREPECLIVVRPGAHPKLVRYIDDSFWEQPRTATSRWARSRWSRCATRVRHLICAERSSLNSPTIWRSSHERA